MQRASSTARSWSAGGRCASPFSRNTRRLIRLPTRWARRPGSLVPAATTSAPICSRGLRPCALMRDSDSDPDTVVDIEEESMLAGQNQGNVLGFERAEVNVIAVKPPG